MIRRALFILATATVLLCPAVANAAEFGIEPGSVTTTALNRNGTLDTQAASHPYEWTVAFKLNIDAQGHSIGGELRDVLIDLPPGMIGNPLAVPRCTRQDFEGSSPHCPPSTQVGVIFPVIPGVGKVSGPIYNVVPPPGVPAQLGFSAAGLNALQNASLRTEEGYGLRVTTNGLPLEVTSVVAAVWGVPADPGHDARRGGQAASGVGPPLSTDAPELPFLTLPADCSAPLVTTVSVDSKINPGNFVFESAKSLGSGGEPEALSGCGSVSFSPQVTAAPSSRLASNPAGLDFELKLPNEGLMNPGGIVETEPEKVEVALPEGVTANPAFAEGITPCSEAAYGAERLKSALGSGCPEASKLGSVIAHSPLLEEPIEGSLYLAAPYENEFGSLVAIYMVLRAPERGILVKQAGEVIPDPRTGQLVTTFEGLPPVPFSDFKLHFREGARAPLVTPPVCGEYRTVAKLYPFSAPNTPVTREASFQIERGAEGGACPPGGTPPFRPGLLAGSINNAAGAYSPFNLRLFRTDAEQEITHFSIKLPPGITGKLAGIPFCSDLQIAAAKAREGQPHGGAEELVSPSCPAASEVGHTLVGAGVGGTLAYVPGKVYLAGPYNGSQLSIVAITAAKAGPFDLGTVVVREALRINPETAEVFVDATGSDPIPHIVNGIPVHLRDIRVYVDRPSFVLNPTSCAPTSTASTVLGSGTDFASEADDQPVTVTTRFQAADCASLAYKPAVALKLRGSTKRGGTPALTAILRPRQGDANSKTIAVALPHSEFLEQGHIKTVCTRVQFKEGAGNGTSCPAGSIYGHAKAWTPLLSDPLEGPVILRTNPEHTLPDLVLALHGLIDFDAVGRIDSFHNGIRNTFEGVPDAPVTKVEVAFQGGKKGLLVNSTDICKGSHKATTNYTAQSGKSYEAKVPLQAQCKKKGKGKGKKARQSTKRSAAWLGALRALGAR